MLAKLGYEDVIEAVDGQDAMSKVFGASPELIVVEHTMPGMSGLGFVKSYHKRGGEAPILMMDDKADRKKVVEAMKAGVVSFVLRPVEPDVFAQHILQSLMKRKSA
jgi:two-component system chemotaxis response regulator CheY